MGSLRVSGKLLTYPFVEPTLTLASYLEQNVCLGKGRWTVSQKRIMIPKMTARDPALPNPHWKIGHCSRLSAKLPSVLVLLRWGR